MRIIYFFLSQLEKCSIGKKREKSLLPEEKEGPFWWTRFWQSRGDRKKFSVKRHPKKGMLGKWETIRKLFDYTLHFAIYYEICPV